LTVSSSLVSLISSVGTFDTLNIEMTSILTIRLLHI
jgi:hypothetical protein